MWCLRESDGRDAAAIGPILFTAFKTITDQHRFPPDVPSAEMAPGLWAHTRPDVRLLQASYHNRSLCL